MPKYKYSNWNGEKDLVAATALAGTKTIPYPLNFRHLTSQILVSAEPEDKTLELTYKLTSVKLTSPSTGTYCFATETGGTGSWIIDNTKTSQYSYDDALPLSFRQNGQIELSSCYWNILPVTDGKIIFRVEYQVLQNGKIINDFTGSKYKEVVVNNPNLTSGKIYTYNFILTHSTDDTISFTTNISDWQNDETTNETLYNPTLTYVTYTDGTVKTFNVSGTISGNGYGKAGTSVFGTQSTVKSIRLGNTVTALDYYAFGMFENLEDIYVPSSVTTIGDGLFYHCLALKSFDIPDYVKDLPMQLFEGCHALEHVTFADDITSVGYGTFNNCQSLKELILPSTVTEIGFMGVSYCYALERLHLSKNLTTIGDKGLYGFKNLKSITIDEGNTNFSVIDNVLYDKTSLIVAASSRTGDLTIPSTIKKIYPNAAEGCHITSLTIPDGVEIGEQAFTGADWLENVTIGANCTLGTNAFRQNQNGNSVTSLNSLTINGKVTFKGFAVFWGCTNLNTITYNSLEAPEFNTSAISSTQNAWSSTTASKAIGYNTRSAGTNMFYIPAAATYTETDIDKNKSILFNSSCSGFTLSKSL